MDYLTERRKYQRCTSTICKTLLSLDKRIWDGVELYDISAGGLKFFSSRELDLETYLNFDVSLYNMLSEFNLKFEGKIVRKEKNKCRNMYAVKFENTDKYCQIQLDEVIKSKIVVAKSNQPQPDYEDGVYTFLLIPRLRRRLIMYR
jgi:c-di-GMP-binding flagellar brake protein YcgR